MAVFFTPASLFFPEFHGKDGACSSLRDGYDSETLRKMYDESRAFVLGEYQTMARLKDCPNIVRCEDIEIVMDSDGIGSKIYIRMELLTPIREYEKLQYFNEEEVIKLGSDICNMLVRCEEESIVHRDIKPENILISDRGDYKLGDFGIARSMDHTTMATKIGTINYMAPEVYLERKYGRAADIYSLGLVLYWLLNNKRIPFFPQDDSEIKYISAAAVQEQRMIGKPVPQPVNGSPDLSKVVLKALSYDPADRYQSALEFGNEIRNCLSEEIISDMSHVCETDSTESSYISEHKTTDKFSQNTVGIFPKMGSSNKENERRRLYENEVSPKRETEKRFSGSEKKNNPGKEKNFRTKGDVHEAEADERAEKVKIFPNLGDEDEREYARQRKIVGLKEKKEADRLECEHQAEERHIADEKAAKKRKRTIIAIVVPIVVAFVVLLTTIIVLSPKYKEAYLQYISRQ